MTTVLNITNTTGYNNWCPGHDHSVLNITNTTGYKNLCPSHDHSTRYHQTTGYKNWCPGHDHSVLNITKQQAVKIGVQAMTTVYSISPNNRL